MKMYNKTDLNYKNGLLVTEDGEVVGINQEVVDLANELETMVQKANWLETQPVACEGPNLVEFKRKSEADAEVDLFDCSTPMLDKKAEESMKLMEEIDLQNLCNDANEMLLGFTPLLQFAKDDTVISCEAGTIRRFDCPTLGNPLNWNIATIQAAVATVHGVKADEETVEAK